jgi:hypothetical protein
MAGLIFLVIPAQAGTQSRNYVPGFAGMTNSERAMLKSVLSILVLTATPVHAQPLTVHMGESWVFSVQNGEPVNARKVEPTAKAPKGQIMVTVRSAFGTNMIMTNSSANAYTFRAELLSGGKTTAVRPCNLPAKNQPILEQWPQKADAVRISHFRVTGEEGRC